MLISYCMYSYIEILLVVKKFIVLVKDMMIWLRARAQRFRENLSIDDDIRVRISTLKCYPLHMFASVIL